MRNKSILSRPDGITIILTLLLMFIGWINIYAAVYDEAHSSIFDLSQRYGKQLLWIVASCGLGIIILMLDTKFVPAFSFIIYFITLLSLVGVLLFGSTIAGAKSWFKIGSFAIQPAEFAKFATCLALARYLSQTNIDLSRLKHIASAALIILLPSILILLQNDTGSALVYFSLVFAFYREGLSGYILFLVVIAVSLFIATLLMSEFIIIGIIAGICAVIYYYTRKRAGSLKIILSVFIISSLYITSVDYAFNKILEPHQKKRINVLIGKETDIRGAGYNVYQSKTAIGSGGFSGKGFLQGTRTKGDFVPEQSTDFIFCTIGEEWGFVGTSVTIILFLLLFARLLLLAERQRSNFSRIYGYGVTSILFFHFAINIGMTIGLAPVIGIPLPFFSYGGSSLWGFTILLTIFLKLDADRRYII
ncbi:MAG: rod shape-determining protein RodA [Hyphomicrobiales bacterium]